ncbi:hypothetical protein DL93DRAFT_2230550 [Clavulina sp. PMI_390]|nr:hypothetical protein DL93DRAFT_2231641 [Clavulina sp. PMI_390]KAF8309980.1 hypothetical protein DL93DRAFT_2230550 [Clavulina sp. PMI_390]
MYLYDAPVKGEPSTTIVEEVSAIIEPLLPRCRHIQFESDAICVQKSFSHPLQLPNQRSLVAGVHQSAFTYLHVFDFTFAVQLLQLTASIFFNYVPCSALELKSGMVLSLTRLNLQGYFKYRSVIKILRNCPHLEYLFLQEVEPDAIEPDPSSLSPMPSLRDVTLHGVCPLSIVSFLDAPSLIDSKLATLKER